jgi:hypothetical protein
VAEPRLENPQALNEAFASALGGREVRENMRGRGLATGLVDVSHRAALGRGVDRAVMQATGSGKPVYAKAGYQDELELSLLLMR